MPAVFFRIQFSMASFSALITLIEVLNVMRRSGTGLGELLRPFRRYVGTGEINFHVADKAAVIRRLAETFEDGEIDYLTVALWRGVDVLSQE